MVRAIALLSVLAALGCTELDPVRPGDAAAGDADVDASGCACHAAATCAGETCIAPPIDQLTTATSHACALTGGRVFCWGKRDSGELGNGSHFRPSLWGLEVPLVGAPVHEIFAGYSTTCAVTGDARGLECWGSNNGTMLGAGARSFETPRSVTGLTDVQQVALGYQHMCFIAGADAASRRLYCMGSNHRGQLGIGTVATETFDTPQAVALPSPPTRVAVHGVLGAFTCVLMQSREVACFGDNGTLQLGRDASVVSDGTPEIVAGLDSIEAIALGRESACAMRSDGSISCWGDNTEGQLGTLDMMGSDSPVPIDFGGRAFTPTTIASGFEHVLAYDSASGELFGWGASDRGALAIADPGPVGPGIIGTYPALDQVLANGRHTCVRAGPTAQCAGSNVSGELGTRDQDDRFELTEIVAMTEAPGEM